MATKNKLQAVFEDRRARELGRTYLRATANKVAGVDGVTPKRISSLGEFCADVAERVRSGAYDARKLLGIPIPKRVPGEFRMICVPTVGDRVAQRLFTFGSLGMTRTPGVGCGRTRLLSELVEEKKAVPSALVTRH
jgi:hypothetical protein